MQLPQAEGGVGCSKLLVDDARRGGVHAWRRVASAGACEIRVWRRRGSTCATVLLGDSYAQHAEVAELAEQWQVEAFITVVFVGLG